LGGTARSSAARVMAAVLIDICSAKRPANPRGQRISPEMADV